MLSEPEPVELMNATHDVLAEELGRLERSIPDEMARALDENIFLFSGFKAYHEMNDASRLLKDEDGGFKPFDRFLQDVQAIDASYNRNWLYAEYNFATASTQMAARWADIERDGDEYDLQYRTALDGLVRPEHAALEGITLPPSDKFWNEYYPPNGWNCRCTAVQVLKDKYPTSDSDKACAAGERATTQIGKNGQNKAAMFRFNPGKAGKVFPPKHPYFKAPEEVKKQVNAIVATLVTTDGLSEDERVSRKANRNAMAKQGRELNRNRRVTYTIDGTEHEFDFAKFKIGELKVDICHHYAASMFGSDDFYLKNEILLNPQSYLDKGVTVGNAAIDPHNSGAATQKLKDATDRFFYIRTTLDNGNEVILHVGRYRDSGKLYLYSASKELPEYARTSQ